VYWPIQINSTKNENVKRKGRPYKTCKNEKTSKYFGRSGRRRRKNQEMGRKAFGTSLEEHRLESFIVANGERRNDNFCGEDDPAQNTGSQKKGVWLGEGYRELGMAFRK